MIQDWVYAVIWMRQFSRDSDRGRGSIDEPEARRDEGAKNRTEARQSENHIGLNVLN